MANPKSILSHLSNPAATELSLASGQKPLCKMGDASEPVWPEPFSNDDILQVLFAAGGSRYVESLGPRPVQWTTRVGLVHVAVSASMQLGGVQARLAVVRRATAEAAAPKAGDKPADALRVQEPPAMLQARAPRVQEPPALQARLPRAEEPPALQGLAPRAEEVPGVVPIHAPRTEEVPGVLPIHAARAEQVSPGVRAEPERVQGERDRFERDREAHAAPVLDLSLATPPDRPAVDSSLHVLDTAFRIDAPPKSRRGGARKAPLPKLPDSSALGRANTVPEIVSPRSRRGGARAKGPPSQDSPTEPPEIEIAVITHDVAPETHRAAARKPVASHQASAAGVELTDIDAPPPTVGRSRRAGGHGAAWEELLRGARQAGASDLHVIAGRPPLLRIAGALVARGRVLDAKTVEAMVMAHVPARLSATLAEEGSCDFALESPGAGRFRVNVARQRTGLKACLRLIPAEIPTLESLGLPGAISLCTRHHQGLVVITGPTGHGKTSTLAAVVDIINRESSHHVITVEDPVEHIHPRKKAMMSQREVGTHTRSFATALKASLREDPDVIVVGELRDTETVRMALAASETGHLVIGTMNTPSAAKTIDRLIDLFPPGDQPQVRVTLAGALKLLVSQRLLPNADGTAMVVAAELLPGSVALGNLIRDSRTYQIPSLMQRGKGLGIVRLDDSLAELVRSGKTTLQAALAVAEAPEELRAACTTAAAVRPAAAPAADPIGRVLLAKAGALFSKKGS